MPRHNPPRSDLPKRREDRPQLGARHPIDYDDGVEDFFGRATFALADAIYGTQTKSSGVIHHRQGFRFYDDPDKVGITVVERRLSHDYARKHRLRWSPNDAGRIRGEIQNVLGRLSLPDKWPIPVTFTDVIRVGDADETRSRKLALIVDQKDPVAEFLVEEHRIVMDVLGRAFKGLRYPYDDYIPKFTVVALDSRLPSDNKNDALAAITELLPIDASIQPIRFTSTQDF